jgi:excinuclease ABC subunit C
VVVALDPRALVARLPNEPGVYRFLDAHGRVLYVGRAVRLRSRVASYWTSLGDRQRLRHMVQRIARVEALACDSEHEAAWLERNLLERRRPRWNRTTGTEVPVFIRLDDQAHLPGLSVVHSVKDHPRGVCFGPYLGGARVRLATSGLHRTLPLAYSGEHLTGLGRDLARVRGVGPDQRAALVRSLRAVLDREPSAMAMAIDTLIALRDSASTNLAFELAAQIQTELEAMRWILGEQKVTHVEARDYDMYGWASGVLVHFEVHDGRLCDWRARACNEAAAGSLVAKTPPAWANFTLRNAELAARLGWRQDCSDARSVVKAD